MKLRKLFIRVIFGTPFITLILFGCSQSTHELDQTTTDGLDIKRESIEWLDVWLPHNNDEGLPRVLLIGNSITRGYHPFVEDLLEGEVFVSRMSTSKSIGDSGLLKEVALVLSYQKFDIVHFNNGLHGWDYTENDFQRCLPDLVKAIEEGAPEAKLIWASITPIYGDRTGVLTEKNKRVMVRNKIAEEFLMGSKIYKNDLYTIGVNHPEFYQEGGGIHPNKDGYKAYGKQVAKSIKEILYE